MKKVLLTILWAMTAFCAMAQSEKIYTEPLVVTINGESTDPQNASVSVITNGNGTINFVLQNFFLSTGGAEAPVGNISIENLPLTKGEDGLNYISFEGSITIQPGNMEGIAESDWIGPLFGDIPMKLQGKINDEKLYVTIDIDMQETIGQVCYVQLGTDDFSKSNEKVYIEPLVITINDMTSEPQEASIVVVDNGDATIDFVLKNFMLQAGDQVMPVGNIHVKNLSAPVGEDGLRHITYNAPMTIQPGDMAGIAESDWIGPMIGEIPLQLQGKMNDEKLFATIYIDMMSTLGQIIKVQLGTDDFSKTGDLNGDGTVDIADAVSILNLMAESTYVKVADLNNDDKVDIADFVSILNIMAEN